MHKNYFDIVMAHIEENVTKPTEEIKREIPNLIGRHSRAFNEYFMQGTIIAEVTNSTKEEDVNSEKKSKILCPSCGEELVFEGGCNSCKACGWSKCDL